MMMVMGVTEGDQNEVSHRRSHLIQHIQKLEHLVEKQKNDSKNTLASSYFTAPFNL